MSEVYSGLRNMAFRMTPGRLGRSTIGPGHAYAIVTDIALGDNVATVVAGADGHASMYLSNGGGCIGGDGNRKVSSAARTAVAVATSALSEMHPTTAYPLPEPGQVSFYVLTTAGVMTATRSESALSGADRPLGHLYDAVQNVITQYRLIL